MRYSCIFFFACIIALAQAGTWRQSEDYYLSDDEIRPRWSHRHSTLWPCDVADYPEAYLLIHKVEKRLMHMDNEETKSKIVDFVVDELRDCKIRNEMDEHCVKRSIGYAMSFISRHEKQKF